MVPPGHLVSVDPVDFASLGASRCIFHRADLIQDSNLHGRLSIKLGSRYFGGCADDRAGQWSCLLECWSRNAGRIILLANRHCTYCDRDQELQPQQIADQHRQLAIEHIFYQAAHHRERRRFFNQMSTETL
jgi:hypothetical protein